MINEISIITELASTFRLLIENTNEKDFGKSTWFNDFPFGCCADTSELLAEYLRGNGVETQLVRGTYGVLTHAWLEYKDYIIDITADQFCDVQEKIIVTDNKEWYAKFNVQERRNVDFDDMDDYNSVRLWNLYRNIVNKSSEV